MFSSRSSVMVTEETTASQVSASRAAKMPSKGVTFTSSSRSAPSAIAWTRSMSNPV